ncbi:MAG: ubiquinone/menaquinone biosynthesis methyltransferase, partial [Chlamydiae bacterium]|nr:ubiquinone/menaquinone biosynthesis methyltransferase [Chlamydiota bacterium]
NKALFLIDLACGTGDQIIASLKRGPHTCIGIDLSTEMLEIARRKIKKTPFKERVFLRHANAMSLPFKGLSFDAATFVFGIRNVPSPLDSLKEIHRVLKPRGKCLILEFSLPKQPWKFFHLFYLRYVLPKIGAWISKDKTAYRYLNETIEAFPYGETFASLMKDAGFQSVQSIPMALGAVSLYIGEK